MGTPAIYISRLAFYGGCTHNTHSWTRILQWEHQRYTSLDLNSIIGAPTIYIPRLIFNSKRTSDMHPRTHILQ